jgi:hypothetical protein
MQLAFSGAGRPLRGAFLAPPAMRPPSDVEAPAKDVLQSQIVDSLTKSSGR